MAKPQDPKFIAKRSDSCSFQGALMNRLMLLLALAAGLETGPIMAADRPPNILLIYADDMGYGDARLLEGNPARKTE